MSDEGAGERRVTIEQQRVAAEYAYQIIDAHLIQQVHINFLKEEEAAETRTRLAAVVKTIRWFEANEDRVKRALSLLAKTQHPSTLVGES